MKKLASLLALSALAFLFAASASSLFAGPKKGSSSGSSSPDTVHVKGYYRKDGTYVAPHDRTAPNSTKDDNWSTKGNVNPETGKPGTKPGDAGTTASPSASSSSPSSSSSSAPATSASTTPSSQPPPTTTAATANTQPSLSKITIGMTKPQVIGQLGEPNVKAEKSWFYIDRGWVRFKAGTVVTGVEAR